LGAADLYAATLLKKALFFPHSDYLRIYYDQGILGLLVYLNLIVFMIKRIKNSITTENSFILVTYLVTISFLITDNLIYTTLPMFIYGFIASYSRSIRKQ